MFAIGRILGFVMFLLSLALGYFLATTAGMGNDLGYTLGCVIGVIGWLLATRAIRASVKRP